MARLDWTSILIEAKHIVESYETGVTLRQLFYRLVSAQLIPNSQVAYKTLSERTALARRKGVFPGLIDRNRSIHRARFWADSSDAQNWIRENFRLDHTTGQANAIYLGVEKAGMIEQLTAWFGDLGFPILPLGGYASQSYADLVRRHATNDDRATILFYAGDWDSSGEDIDRDFIARSDCWTKTVRVALTVEQVAEYQLPENPGKASDSRSAAFVERHGRLVQVELDALDPNDLRDLFIDAISPYWQSAAYDAILADEERQRDDL